MVQIHNELWMIVMIISYDDDNSVDDNMVSVEM